MLNMHTRLTISLAAPLLWLNVSEATENPLSKCQALLSNLRHHTKSIPSEMLPF